MISIYKHFKTIIKCKEDNVFHLVQKGCFQYFTINPFNFAAIKFCVFEGSEFHWASNLQFSNCTHVLKQIYSRMLKRQSRI